MKEILYELIVNNNIQILNDNINWYTLLSSSISEKVDGYLFKCLKENNYLKYIPKPVKKTLYISYQYNLRKNSIYIKEFQNIQRLLNNNGIPVFAYKGLFLIKSIYEDYGVRYMEDIDIILKATDYLILENILKRCNYQLTLINESKISQYVQGTPVSSCLFVKNNLVENLVPFIKIDCSFLLENSKEIQTISPNKELSLQYNFVLLCRSFFEEACQKRKIPVPQDCTLMKFIDIKNIITKYPLETKYILFNSCYADTKYMKYVNQCINYFYEGDQL